MTKELNTVCVCGLSNCAGNGRVMKCPMCFDQNLAVYRLQFSLPTHLESLRIKCHSSLKTSYPTPPHPQRSPLIIILRGF